MSPDSQKNLERYISLGLLLGVAVWDGYCQAHQLPYKAPWWLIGVMLAPFGEDAYIVTKKIPAAIQKLTQR